MRPEISDKTEERIRKWIKEHPEKGISDVGSAIDYLAPKGIKYEEQNTEQAIREIVKEELEKQS